MNDTLIYSIISIITGALLLYGTLKAYFKEHSIGKTAMGKIKEECKEIKDELDKVRKQLKDLDEDVKNNTRRIDKLIDRLIEKSDF